MKTVTLTKIFFTLTILAILLNGFCHAGQPSYQVSLFIHLHPKGPPMHLCNGAIVQSKLILTTAACVHYLLIPDKPIIPVHPSMLTVVAGSADAFIDALEAKVSEIIFHEGFNETTMENDLALLRLSTFLPLGIRDDIKWIILDEYRPNDAPCLANFHVRNSMDQVPDYTQTQELIIEDTGICGQKSPHPTSRQQDICSSYILPLNFKCDDFNSFVPFNGDRGTGLICNSHLVGVLSAILPLEEHGVQDCSEKLVKAFYTDISAYIDWAYEIIAYEEYNALMQADYKASTPYDQKTENIMQSQFTQITIIEADSSSTTVVPTTTVGMTSTPGLQSLNAGATQIILDVSMKLTLVLLIAQLLCAEFL